MLAHLIGRSNDPRAAEAVRTLGWDNDAAVERRAADANDVAAYDLAHVLLGFQGAVPAPLTSAGFYRHRGATATWMSGTIAQWVAAARLEALADPKYEHVRAGIAKLVGGYAALRPFGDISYVPSPKGMRQPIDAIPDEAHAACGGVLVVALDRTMQTALTDAGGRILDRVGETPTAPSWARTNGNARGRGRRPLGRLIVPIDDLGEAEQTAVAEFNSAYAKLHAVLGDSDAAEVLRLPCEGDLCLVSVTYGVLDALSRDDASRNARWCAAQLRAALQATTPRAPA
jgi:hypothetical protein